MSDVLGLAGRFNDVSISKKLASSFALLVVGMVAVVLVGSSGMGSMQAAHNDVLTSGVPKQLAAQEARGAAADMHYSQTLYVLDHGTGRADYLQDHATYVAAVRHLVALSTDASDKPWSPRSRRPPLALIMATVTCGP